MVRIKQIDIDELYNLLDGRYGDSVEVVVEAEDWEHEDEDEFYTQTIDLTAFIKSEEGISENTKMIVEAVACDTLEETYKAENYFDYIDRIETGDNKITIYSRQELTESFTIKLLYFG